MRISSIGMIRLSDKISINLFFFVSVFIFFWSQTFMYSLLFVFSATLHECSHLYFLRRYDIQIKHIAIYPFGVDINADTSRLSYKKELICTLAGSFSNLFFALITCFVFYIYPTAEILFFILCNLFLGLVNLIPLSFFDGGKALRLIIYDVFDINKAFFIHRSLDILSALLFICLCVYIIMGSNFNFSVCAVIMYASVSTLALYTKNPCRKH